jgi:hypothetical protein
MRIEVPTSLEHITIKQFLKWKHATENSSEEFLPFQLISIFCNIELNEVIKIPLKQFEDIIFTIGKALEETPKHVQRFTMNGVEYGFIPNFDNVSTAEYVDLDTYIDTDVLKAMMVMYRPINQTFGKDLYNIKEYNGTDGFEIMNDAPASVFLGAKVFFWNLGTDLKNYIPRYLERVTTEEEKIILEKNGVGISQLTQLLEGIDLNTNKSMDLPYINSLHI